MSFTYFIPICNLGYGRFGGKITLADGTLTDVDWAATIPPALSTEVFITTLTYDALNRVVTRTDPGSNVTRHSYDEGGQLNGVYLTPGGGSEVTYVSGIHYNAKGQREAIWYGNGTKTSYRYDKETFRLKKVYTRNTGGYRLYQGLEYFYDPVGNITQLTDKAYQRRYFDNTVASPDQKFRYDALYRLVQAQGRELKGTADFGDKDNWDDAPWQTSHKGDGNAVQNYTQQYSYDRMGNILTLQHIASVGSYTCAYSYDGSSNRLTQTEVGAKEYVNSYDVRGNLTSMPHMSAMDWNLRNELHHATIGTVNAYYQYSGGQRVRKVIDKTGGIKEERIYLGDYEVYRKFDGSSLKVERITVHVSDDTGRIAMYEKRTAGDAEDDDDTTGVLTRYIYSNHLGSAALELDHTAAIISYEEYHPYGTTSYQAMNTAIAAVAKRYRWTGKERDEETGLYYHGARYYIPWLARWSAVDPLQGEMPEWSSYNYGYCNPIIWTDSTGMQPDEQQQQAFQEGERQTQVGFQKSLDEIQNSNAHPDFKKWAGEVGLSGVVSLRDQLFASKISTYQNAPGARAMYGYDPNAEGNGVLVPESIRQRLWTEANEQAIPVLKATWAVLQSGGETSGLTFQHNLNMTISNRAEGWDAITGAAIGVGVAWSAHLIGGGLSNLKQTGEIAKQSFSLSNDEAITLYRGVNSSSPAYDDALKGIVNSRGGSSGHMDAYIHNAAPEGTATSNLTSWTKDYDVALNYAYRPSREGVVLTTNVSLKRTISSPSLKNVNLAHKPGTIVNENEVLLIGKIKIEPFKIKKVRF